jgi:hypothetical protein
VAVPEKVVVNIGDETLVERRLVGLLVEFVRVQLELNLSHMGLGDAHGSQKTPCYSEHVVFVVLTLIVAIEQGLVVEVQNFKEEESVGVHELRRWVVDIYFCMGGRLLWFQTPLELPSCLKSQQAVAKGSKISFSVDSYFLSILL